MDPVLASSLRPVVAAILLENGIEEIDDDLCMNMLEFVMMKHIMKLGSLTQSFAEHATRYQAHFADAIMSVAFAGTNIVGLKDYVESYKFPRVLEGLRLVPDQVPPPPTPIIFQSGHPRRLPRYIQDYFPPVPSVYTFENTPVQKQNKLDYKQARERISAERRQVEKSLHTFHHRLVISSGGRYDSPFNLEDPCFSLLPATYHLEQPAYIAALVPSPLEDRRREEPTRKETEQDKRREAEDESMMRENVEANPRKYRKTGPRKEKGEKKERDPNKKPGGARKSKAAKAKEDSSLVDDSSSMGVFSPS